MKQGQKDGGRRRGASGHGLNCKIFKPLSVAVTWSRDAFHFVDCDADPRGRSVSASCFAPSLDPLCFPRPLRSAMSRPVTDPNLLDLTNVYRGQAPTTSLPTPPSERKRVRQLEFDVRDKKRLKFDTPTKDNHPTDVDSDTSTDDEDKDKPPRTKTTCQYSVYGLRTQMMLAGPSRMPSPSMSEPHFVCILLTYCNLAM